MFHRPNPTVTVDIDLDDVLYEADIEDVVRYYDSDKLMDEMAETDVTQYAYDNYPEETLAHFTEEELRKYLKDQHGE